MFKCDDCDAYFFSPLQIYERHGFQDGPAERRNVCPYCGGDILPVISCRICGEEKTEDEMVGTICLECLELSISYDSFLGFSEEREDKSWNFTPNHIQTFLFENVFNITGMTESSKELRAEMRELYLRKVAHEKLTGKTTLLDAIKRYVLDDMFIATSYAEWLGGET